MKTLGLQLESLDRSSPIGRISAPVGREALDQYRSKSSLEAPTTDHAIEAVGVIGNIRLMEGWTSSNPDITFKHQTLEIRQAIRVARIGRDGRLSVTSSPKIIRWYGGSTAILEHIVHVKVVSRGVILVDDALCTQNGRPQEIPGGVSFEVVEV